MARFHQHGDQRLHAMFLILQPGPDGVLQVGKERLHQREHEVVPVIRQSVQAQQPVVDQAGLSGRRCDLFAQILSLQVSGDVLVSLQPIHFVPQSVARRNEQKHQPDGQP